MPVFLFNRHSGKALINQDIVKTPYKQESFD
jgi:hypothetical protein